jgi:hypothetical protein
MTSWTLSLALSAEAFTCENARNRPLVLFERCLRARMLTILAPQVCVLSRWFRIYMRDIASIQASSISKGTSGPPLVGNLHSICVPCKNSIQE